MQAKTFREILLQHRIPHRCSLTKQDEIRLHCPFCLERRGMRDTNFCLHINARSGAGHCWHASCDYRSLHALTQILDRLNILAATATAEGVTLPVAQPAELPEDFQLLSNIYTDLDYMARKYILKRGVTMGQIHKHHIGISLMGRYAYRVIFPVTDPDGMILYGITARDFTGRQQPKYLTNPGPKYLFNFDPAAKCCILSEGVIKALRIEQVTNYCSAALLGHSLTEDQLKQIQTSRCEHVILWPDIDRVGRKGAVQIADQLTDGIVWKGQVSFVWPVTEPADESTVENLRKTLDRCVKPYSSVGLQRCISQDLGCGKYVGNFLR